MHEPTKSITREELYEEVWRTPMSKLSEAWGVSISRITNACIEMNVPRPDSNHWQLVPRGWKLKREVLPPSREDTPSRTVLLRDRFGASVDAMLPTECTGSPETSRTKSHLPKEPKSDSLISHPSPDKRAELRLAEQGRNLDAFDKLETALSLIREAIELCPRLEALQLNPLSRELAAALQILSLRDSELDLAGLMMKHDWSVGQHFYVRCEILEGSQSDFVVLPDQDLPEGIVIATQKRGFDLPPGKSVCIDLLIKRKGANVVWHIRAIDP